MSFFLSTFIIGSIPEFQMSLNARDYGNCSCSAKKKERFIELWLWVVTPISIYFCGRGVSLHSAQYKHNIAYTLWITMDYDIQPTQLITMDYDIQHTKLITMDYDIQHTKLITMDYDIQHTKLITMDYDIQHTKLITMDYDIQHIKLITMDYDIQHTKLITMDYDIQHTKLITIVYDNTNFGFASVCRQVYISDITSWHLTEMPGSHHVHLLLTQLHKCRLLLLLMQ